MIAGASFNIAQYVVTEAVHNRHPFAHGGRLLWSAGIGALSGGVDEPFRPTVIYRGRHPITRLPAATLWKRAWRDVTPGLRIARLVRSGAASRKYVYARTGGRTIPRALQRMESNIEICSSDRA